MHFPLPQVMHLLSPSLHLISFLYSFKNYTSYCFSPFIPFLAYIKIQKTDHNVSDHSIPFTWSLKKASCFFSLEICHLFITSVLRLQLDHCLNFLVADFQSIFLLFCCRIAKQALISRMSPRSGLERSLVSCDVVVCNLPSLTCYSHSV